MNTDHLADLVFESDPSEGPVRHARHRRTGMAVVVKADDVGGAGSGADLLLAAHHPGVLAVLDHHRGSLYVTPRLAGTLADLVRAHGGLGERATTQLVLHLADALQHLHHRGLVHGDLSPGNVLLHGDGQPVLADPSPAAMGSSTSATAGYVAPEVAEGEPATPSADLHALGVLALECLGAHQAPHLRDVLARAASPNPADRPASAADLARAVADAVPGTTWLDRASLWERDSTLTRGRPHAAPPPATRTFGPRPPVGSDEAPPQSSTRRRTALRLAGALVGVALAATVTVVAVRRDTNGPGCTNPTPASVDDPAVVAGDLDGDGCTEAVRWQPDDAVLELPGGRRLQVGEPDDRLLLGDWDCDDVDTPALYRPSTGEVFEFATWVSGADALMSSETHQTGVHDGTPAVVPPTGAGCDRVAVDPGGA
jgi:hypothetical protein